MNASLCFWFFIQNSFLDIYQFVWFFINSGIKCFMVTGDHPATAATVAKQFGLIKTTEVLFSYSIFYKNWQFILNLHRAGFLLVMKYWATKLTKIVTKIKGHFQNGVDKQSDLKNSVIHGEILSKLTPQEWDTILMQQSVVFARTTPEQKLVIVKVNWVFLASSISFLWWMKVFRNVNVAVRL